MTGESVIMFLLLAVSGARSRTFSFVDLKDNNTFSQSLEYCTNISYSGPNEFLPMSELQNISHCARQLGLNGSYWINYETEKSSRWHCTFEPNDSCFLSDVTRDGYSWSRGSGRTNSSNTGPSGAYEGLYYTYMEATNVSVGRWFILRSDFLPDLDMCLFFRYHMYGKDIGKLMIFLSSNKIWERTGNQDERWRSKRVYLNPSQGRRLHIIAVRGRDYRGDIALDDVRLKFGRCNSDCGDTFFADSGMLLSEGYPKDYPPDRDCVWEVRVSTGKQIILHVNDFQLEDTDECYDYLEVFNGNNGSRYKIFCGSITEDAKTLNTYTNYLILNFHSDVSEERRGFNLTWTTVSVSCPVVNVRSGEIMATSKPCSDVLENVICFSNQTFDSEPECRFYPPQITIEETSTSLDLSTEISKSTLNLTDITGLNIVSRVNPSPTSSAALSASTGAAVGVVALIVIIITVVCVRRRRQDKTKKTTLHSNGVFNQNYTFNTCQGIISNSTDQENYFILEEKQDSHDADKAPQQAGTAGNYENTKLKQDDTYNHLNEAAIEKDTNDYSHCTDLNSYDHLPSHVSPGDATLDDNYDHAGKDVDADDNYDHAKKDVEDDDNYDHAGKDADAVLGNMKKVVCEESDYMNTGTPHVCNDDSTYEKAGNIA